MDIHIYINNNKKAGTLVRRGAYPLPGAANGVEQSVTHLNAAQGKVARKEEARDARTAAASLFFFFYIPVLCAIGVVPSRIRQWWDCAAASRIHFNMIPPLVFLSPYH
jgi:hypothetical protein